MPPPAVDIVEWAAGHYIVPRGANAGPWRSRKTPFAAEILRASVEPGYPREVVVMAGAQVGKTEDLLISWAYRVVHEPAGGLFIMPTLEACRDLNRDRLDPLVAAVPELRERVADRSTSDNVSGSTVYRKEYGAGSLVLVGSNSATGLSRHAVPTVYLSELDRLAGDVNGEGPPLELARVRTRTFPNAKIFMESTPTIAGQSLVEDLFLDSSRERWFLPCPHCGWQQTLRWNAIDFASLEHACESCGDPAPQGAWQSGEGEWRPENPGHPIRRGFHLPAWNSPLIDWRVIVDEFVTASHKAEEGDPTKLRVWKNLSAAEPWTQAEDPLRENELLARAEEYPAELPEGVRTILGAIDTQDDRLPFLVAGIGKGKQVWLLEYGTVVGRLESDAEGMLHEVDERLLRRVWRFADGRGLALRRAAWDARGHHTSTVYRAVKERARHLVAIQGLGQAPTRPNLKRHQTHLERAPLLSAVVDHYKDRLASVLKLETPGAGYWHLPHGSGFDEYWAREMTSEVREIRWREGRRIGTWRKRHSSVRNEGWDLAVMILALTDDPMTLAPRWEEWPIQYVEREGETHRPVAPVPRWGVQRAHPEAPPLAPEHLPPGTIVDPRQREEPRRLGAQRPPNIWRG
jgi:phage terminase large subunit GpA-like protein